MRRVTASTRAALAVFLALVALALASLLGQPSRTDQFFAWTIEPPIIAVFLGAGYAAGLVLVGAALGERLWSGVRLAVPAVVLRDAHPGGHPAAPGPLSLHGVQSAAASRRMVGLIVYVIVPPALALVGWRQERMPGTDPLRRAPLAPVTRVWLVIQVALFGGVGATLFATPELRLPALTGTAFAVLQLGVLAAFAAQVGWGRPSAWLYVCALLGLVAMALQGLRQA